MTNNKLLTIANDVQKCSECLSNAIEALDDLIPDGADMEKLVCNDANIQIAMSDYLSIIEDLNRALELLMFDNLDYKAKE